MLKLKNIKTNLKKKNINFFFPIAFILGIVPLIVRMTIINSDENTFSIFGPTAKIDLFSQKKASFLIVFCIILITISIIFFKRIFEKKDKTINSSLVFSSIL